MSLSGTFNPSGNRQTIPAAAVRQRARDIPPFSLRLSPPERARLVEEAVGAPLGAYIKAKVLGTTLPVKMRRSGLAVEDRQVLARALALLGQSRFSSNLNQLARASNLGVLTMTPEIEAELHEAFERIREIRRLLLTALGLKEADGSS